MADGFAGPRTQAGERSSGSPYRPHRQTERAVPRDRTIYVVDDDAGVRRSLEQLLKAEGFALMSFDSATAFLEAAPGLAPGCILLDVRMPEMDGLELQEQMRDHVIALTVVIMSDHGGVCT